MIKWVEITKYDFYLRGYYVPIISVLLYTLSLVNSYTKL